MSDTDTFRSLVVSQGLAKTARYRVNINDNGNQLLSQFYGTQTDLLSYMCEQAELPGRSMEYSDIYTYGISNRYPYGTTINTSNFTFLVTEPLWEKQFFDSWLAYIHGKDAGYDLHFRDDYATTIDIITFAEWETSEDTGQFMTTLIDAYPVQITPLPLSWADDNFHRIQVDFTYTDYVDTRLYP